MERKILEVGNLCKYYGRSENQTKALDGISFQVFSGEFLGIMGSSGSGKSTLLNCIAAELAEYRGKKIGYLFQNFELLDNLTGRENILLPLALHGVSAQAGRERLEELASYLEIPDVLDKFPAQMSGGQKQRVAAARALILNPAVILADEPTGALDSKNAKALMKKLSGLSRKQNATILMVTHDSAAASYCRRILFIRDGVIFHELRRNFPEETQEAFYERILKVTAQLGGGSAHVL